MVEESKAHEGYKVTEIGVIPDDWEVKKLAEICTLSNQKYNPQKNTDNFPCIELEHISPEIGRLLGTTNSLDQLSMKNYFFKGDTLLGKLRPYLKKYLYAYFDGVCSTEIWVLRPQNDTDDRYLYYMIQSEKVIDACNKSSGTKMPRAEWKVVQDTIIQLPPLQEQKSIAEALSNTDNLIISLEKLIDKKKKIKQGAMQQLLTGKKRLPGFSEQWEIKKLGDIVSINKGQLITEKDAQDGTIPVIAGGKKPAYYHSFPNRQGKTITISASGANAGYVGFYTEPIFASDCSTIGENNGYSIEFIYYQLSMLQENIYYAQSGGAQPHIHPKDLKPLLINYTNLKEQKAIAQVLSDMDAEIEGLEEKLEKYKTIKQGMMQELLTGRIRLI